MISTTTASRRHSPERPISCQSPIADAAARLLNIASVDPITHPECVSPQLLRARPTWISPILMWPPASWASTTCNRTPGTDLAAWVRDRPRLPRRRLRSAYLNPPSPMRLRLHYHRRTRCGHVPRGHRRHRPRPAYTGREPPLKPTSSPEVHTQRGTSTNWAKPRCFKLRPPPRLAAACAVLRSAAAIPRAVVRPLDAGATSPRRKPPQWDCLAGFSQRGVRETCWKICSKNAAECSVLHRKNAYFYKTKNGARVGDLFMSLIYTCELCDANPFDYLVALQRHHDEASKSPSDWMPWNYTSTLANLTPAAASAI